MALPALPVPKTRQSTESLSGIKITPTNLPKSGLRAPSASHIASAPPTPVPSKLQTPATSGGKTLKKQISINAFPQPPRSVRTSSLPPSPLCGNAMPGLGSRSAAGSRRESAISPVEPGSVAVKPRKRNKASTSPKRAAYMSSSTPSLLNGSGDGRSISSGPGARGSDGLLSLPSPPQSRSSSAQGSYSTSATTNEDQPEGSREHIDTDEATVKDGASKSDGKGNVIVSVRVRPDAGTTKSNEDWVVDGRRSLVAHRGKEGGDYFYGIEQTARDLVPS